MNDDFADIMILKRKGRLASAASNNTIATASTAILNLQASNSLMSIIESPHPGTKSSPPHNVFFN